MGSGMGFFQSRIGRPQTFAVTGFLNSREERRASLVSDSLESSGEIMCRAVDGMNPCSLRAPRVSVAPLSACFPSFTPFIVLKFSGETISRQMLQILDIPSLSEIERPLPVMWGDCFWVPCHAKVKGSLYISSCQE
ncbi:unnamed protein product [Hapterophycus canaliculatus]